MSAFIDSIKVTAKELYYKYGILPSITISQAVLESGNGTSGLTRRANNLFGVKGIGTAGSIEMSTTEYINGQPEKVLANFRAYNSYSESLSDYGELLGTAKRYEGVRTATDYKSALTALSTSGYATDPSYTSKLSTIILDNQLFNLDTEVAGTTPIFSDSGNSGGGGGGGGGAGGTNNVVEEKLGVLETIESWLKTAGFLTAGLIILVLGLWFLFK